MTSLGPHVFWITSRAAGVSALLLSSVSVGLGLAMAARLGGGRLADRRILHEALSIGVMISIVVHAGSLLFDGFLHPSVADVTVPFAFDYQRMWTTLGIVSGWGMLLFGLAYYARRHIGMRRWKVVHRLTLVTWIGGLVHSLGEGTDVSQGWFLALVVLAVTPSLVLLAVRVGGRDGRPARTGSQELPRPLPPRSAGATGH